MKIIKAIALAGVFAFAANASAQENHAPQAKDFSLEVQFNPFSNNFETFKMDQVKARYYFSDKDAVRIGLGFGIGNSKNVANPDDDNNTWYKQNESTVSIDLGYERNFYSYKRINLYAGAGIGFDYNKEVKTTQKLVGDNTYGKTSHHEGDWGFYAKAFTGIDFFVYKGLYVGAELNLKVGVRNNLRTYDKGGITESGNWSDNYEGPKGPKSSDFVLGLGAEPALRLGWQF